MAVILNIETSTSVCSTALSVDGEIEFHLEDYKGQSHATQLGVFVDQTMKYAEDRKLKLDAVAVSCGPGSYTGLRIGVSMAKGICFGQGIPLIAIPTHKVMSVIPLLYNDLPDNALICPMIDARRMEVYSTVYDKAFNVVKETSAEIITEDSYKELLDKGPVYFFGDGAEKCKETIKHENAHFISNINPLAKSMPLLAEKAFLNGEFQDVAYFEPFYLKEFVASTPKKLL